MTPELKELFFSYLHGYADAMAATYISSPPIKITPVQLRQTKFFKRYCNEWDEKIGMEWLKEWLVMRNKI